MDRSKLSLEVVNENNKELLKQISRDDVSEDFAFSVETTLDSLKNAVEKGYNVNVYAARYGDDYIGVVMLGEAVPWPEDPEEMKRRPFCRLTGFVIDKQYRGMGVGTFMIEEGVRQCFKRVGVRPIALCVHKDNHRAEKFYRKHGFTKRSAMQKDDYYFIRYPEGETPSDVEIID